MWHYNGMADYVPNHIQTTGNLFFEFICRTLSVLYELSFRSNTVTGQHVGLDFSMCEAVV